MIEEVPQTHRKTEYSFSMPTLLSEQDSLAAAQIEVYLEIILQIVNIPEREDAPQVNVVFEWRLRSIGALRS